MRYRVQVLATVSSLQYREGPNKAARLMGTYDPGDSFIASDQSVDTDGTIWFQNSDTNYWSIFRSGTTANLKIVYQYPEPTTRSVTSSSNSSAAWRATTYDATPVATTANHSNSAILANSDVVPSRHKKVPKEVLPEFTSSRVGDTLQQNQNAYPRLLTYDGTGRYQYDYAMDMTNIELSVDIIRKNLNIPSLYEPRQVNRLMHTQFNRYKIGYPDYERNVLIPYVFFTRPDLNVFDDNGAVLEMYYSRPVLHYLVSSNPQTIRTLTLGMTAEHDFNPLLSNRVGSLDVQDEVIDVSETGETFTGYKSQYAKHGIRSITAGQLSIKFPETYNLALTTLHQFWCGYESDVYRGYLDPKEEYIGGKILDYACDIYYFLTDKDGVLRFWTKYFGCFPSNVNKSIFSYDAGSMIQFPEMNITYNYIYKEDLSPDTIVEFNRNAKITKNQATAYVRDHDAALGHYGTTWVGTPFLQEIFVDEGDTVNCQRFVLRFKPAPADTLVDSVIRAGANTNLGNKTVDYNQINPVPVTGTTTNGTAATTRTGGGANTVTNTGTLE